MIRFASLGSGSKGNATLVAAGDTLVMVDCGFPRREVEVRLQRLGVAPDRLDAILVTHEHGDHSAGVASLAKAYGLPVYLSHGTAATKRLGAGYRQVCINAGEPFSIGDLDVQSVAVPHDAREPVQFRFGFAGASLGVLTDLGSVTPHVVEAYSRCDGLLLEFNHDRDLLRSGPYPAPLKRRVAGDYGHLNNDQAVELLRAVACSRLKVVLVGHISQQNNTLEHVQRSLERARGDHQADIIYAAQSEVCHWIEVRPEPAETPSTQASAAG